MLTTSKFSNISPIMPKFLLPGAALFLLSGTHHAMFTIYYKYFRSLWNKICSLHFAYFKTFKIIELLISRPIKLSHCDVPVIFKLMQVWNESCKMKVAKWKLQNASDTIQAFPLNVYVRHTMIINFTLNVLRKLDFYSGSVQWKCKTIWSVKE